MIIQSKAVTPKVSTASSTYSAIILNIVKPTNKNDNYVNLQVFCPSVMSGSVVDAQLAGNNWITAPKGPHDDILYNYQIGGLVIISYQNGNTDMPQFVRFVEISDDVIKTNYSYIKNGVAIVADNDLIDISGDMDLSEPGIQKGVKLLEALKACNSVSNGIFHTFGYNMLNAPNFLSIYRCGKYGIELISKKDNTYLVSNNYIDDSFNYLDNLQANNKHSWRGIFLQILADNSEYEISSQIISIVNKAIERLENNSNLVTVYSDINEADLLFWCTKIVGMIYYPEPEKDRDDGNWTILQNLTDKVINDNLKYTKPKEGSKLFNILQNYGGSILDENVERSLYRGKMRIDQSCVRNESLREDIFNFIKYIYEEMDNNSFFNEKIGACYATFLTSNMQSLKITYGNKTESKALLICDLIASAYPALEQHIIEYFDPNHESNNLTDDLKSFSSVMIDCISSGDDSKLPSPEMIADNFSKMYFYVLGWSKYNKSYDWVDNPQEIIYNQMLRGVNYILNNYNDTDDSVGDNNDDNEPPYTGGVEGFMWPVPGFYTITSPFGPRIINGKQDNHTGIDISGNNIFNQPVLASVDGVVDKVVDKFAPYGGGEADGYGNYVRIKHKNNTHTLYGHLASVNVSLNQEVKQGQTIGRIDSTGWSTGNHLHFEIRINGTAIDPENYVNPNKN